MCEEKCGSVRENKPFISEDNDPQTDLKKWPDGYGVRANPRKAEDDPNLETKFKQELNNPAVRDHDGSVAQQLHDTDLMIEDLTVQLAEAQLGAENIKVYANRCFNMYLNQFEENLALRAKVRKYENNTWRKLAAWFKKEWYYDIYRPAKKF